ncbi:hypothetical protein SAMN05192534_11320 [Alteribacillus persepolensis]|uniref:Uncharacterized protein n=1 Tax=Alteribacillus persepolensis TaxID=568899 RepID=A0A1G8FU23_9BACI|nr:hypothetical protein [Alteribacillus persepolensis]SDH85624.1 hypothetical protein SAMN05192534_11320 [Alteribacillus persepolensis]
MAKNKKNKNHQFKENKHHGEHRNGRLSQFKNHSVHGGDVPNEYINK